MWGIVALQDAACVQDLNASTLLLANLVCIPTEEEARYYWVHASWVVMGWPAPTTASMPALLDLYTRRLRQANPLSM